MRCFSPVNIDVDAEKHLIGRGQKVPFMISPGPNNTCIKYENYCRVLWLTLMCVTIVAFGTKHTISHYRSNFITPVLPVHLHTLVAVQVRSPPGVCASNCGMAAENDVCAGARCI